MRTCLGEAARMVADDLSVQDFNGAKWLLLSGYCFYGEHLLQRAIELAAEANIKVALDLASFEIVQSFKQELKDVLESGRVHCCFCNEVCFVGLLVTCCLLQLKDVLYDTTAWLHGAASLPSCISSNKAYCTCQVCDGNASACMVLSCCTTACRHARPHVLKMPARKQLVTLRLGQQNYLHHLHQQVLKSQQAAAGFMAVIGPQRRLHLNVTCHLYMHLMHETYKHLLTMRRMKLQSSYTKSGRAAGHSQRKPWHICLSTVSLQS
jgi:hypothetical protein